MFHSVRSSCRTQRPIRSGLTRLSLRRLVQRGKESERSRSGRGNSGGGGAGETPGETWQAGYLGIRRPNLNVTQKGLEDPSSYFFMGYAWAMRFLRVGCTALLGWLIVIGIGGCAGSTTPTPAISVLPKADDSAERLVAYLETRHVPLTKVNAEETRIMPGASCRECWFVIWGCLDCD